VVIAGGETIKSFASKNCSGPDRVTFRGLVPEDISGFKLKKRFDMVWF